MMELKKGLWIILGAGVLFVTMFLLLQVEGDCAKIKYDNYNENIHCGYTKEKHIVKGYVLSFADNRWESTKIILESLNIFPIRVDPVPYKSNTVQTDGQFVEHPELANLQKTHSNKFSHRKAWAYIATDYDVAEDGYSLVFENDIMYNNATDPKYLLDVMNFANNISHPNTGIFYLGICGGTCSPVVQTFENVDYKKCCGRCAHAYGVMKKHAMFYYDLLAARCGKRSNGLIRPGTKEYTYMDMYMECGHQFLDQDEWVVTVIPPQDPKAHPEHQGIFNQDRERFHSQI